MPGERDSKRKWWICSNCDFWNHPRLVDPEASKCEQCGKPHTDQDAPYDPAARRQ